MARFKWDFLQLTGVFPRTVWLSGQTLQWNISVFPISLTDLVSVSTECVFVETVFCNIMQSFNLSSKQSTFYIYKEILPLELWKAMTEPHVKIISDVMSVTELLLFAVIQRRMTASERCPKQLI